MSGILLVVLIFFGLAAGLGVVAYLTYQRKLRRAKAIERGLKMVPILIHLPPPSSDTEGGTRDVREVMREKTAQAEVLYSLIAGTATEGFKSNFYGQRHIALELIAIDGIVHFYAAVPVALVSVVKKAIQTAYPGARLEEVEDHNIFNQEGRLAATLGGEMVLRAESAYPVATYAKLERDPMEALLTTISALEKKDGVAVQIMVRPAPPSWTKRSIALADNKRKGRSGGLMFSAMDLVKAAVKSPAEHRAEEQAHAGGGNMVSNLQLSEVESIEEKTKHPGFEVLIRVIVSTSSVVRSQQLLRDIATAFALFEAPGMNGFKFLPALDVQGLVTAFIFRFFPPELKSNILNSVELATLFHLPDSQFTPSSSVERQQSKQVDGPVQLPSVGLLFGYNDFRGVKKEIRLSTEDRRRHTYILGQTGTGKSTMLENLAVQDMQAGNGFAFIDPHGDSAEKLLALVPKNRAEDVIYFNPSDTQYPLGLNLFEFSDPAQKDFLVQETINMLYKLYDPGHTGIIGPRYEHWYRNAALTLMSDPNGATFIEIPKVFTDTEYLKQKFKYLRDPTVIDFWTKEMGQTSDYHKSEMLGWFVSKFGAFQNNEMMRNIIGQTKSSFNMREVMDKKKILIVNLSKGRIGELNSQLLGMIFVIKFQAAAMSRADTPEDQRPDFSLYVDEFQNFSTDSFASILSEARKYRLNVIVANQFIGQLSEEIRDAVFGNIGTIIAHRMGPEDAEFMVKQFSPVFDTSDLINIPNYNAAMRLMIGGLPSQPFSVRNLGPLGNPNLELGLAVKQLSAAKYGRIKNQVEADILDRFSGRPVPGVLEPAAAANASVAPVSPAPQMPAASPGVVAPGAVVAPSPVAMAPVAQPAPAVSTPVSVAAAMPASAAPVVAAAPAVAAPVMPAQQVAAMPVAPVAPAPAAPVLQGMAVAPPPIGAAPVEVSAAPAEFASAGGAPVMTNTAGQPMMPASNIIPEENLEAEADRMAQAGGFAPLGSPIPAPVAEALPTGDMAVTPPPIGAPPIGVPVASAEPTIEPIIAPTPAPAVMAPPPIGAPPIDLPVQAQAIVPVEDNSSAVMPLPARLASGPGTLSLNDITGGKPLPQSLELTEIAPMPQPAPAAEIPVLAQPVPAAPAPRPISAAPFVPLGSGMPREDDPYANIDVLGDLTPPVSPVAPAAEVPLTESAPSTGVASPNDPYAQIDVLGAAPAPVPTPMPVSAPPAPEPMPAPAAASSLMDVPILADAQGAQPPAPQMQLEPVGPPAMPVSLPQPMPAPAPVQPRPVIEEELPLTAPQMQPVEAPVPEQPMASPAPALEAAPTPLVAAPPVAMEPIPVLVPSAPAPVVAPEPVVTPEIGPSPIVAPSPMPQPVAMPEPEPRDPTPAYIPEPEPREAQTIVAAEPALPAEPLIHFVDPAAQAVLDSPEVPDRVSVDESEPLLSGLPEGVQITKPEPVVSAPVMPVTPLPAPAQVAPPVVAPVPVPAPAPVVAPVESPVAVAPPVSPMAPAAPAPVAPAVPEVVVSDLANMAVAPPPIGAAPVELAPISATPAPAPVVPAAPVLTEPQDAEIAKAAANAPVPELNASLAEVLEKAPVPPAPEPTQAPAEPASDLDKVESVADMLEEAHDKTAQHEDVPASPAENSDVSESKKVVEVAEPVVEAEKVEPSPEPAKEAPKPVTVDEAPAVADTKPAPKDLASETPQEEKEKETASPSTAAAQIEKAEHEIDDLLSVSLIHSDASATHRRLPEPVAPVRNEEDEGLAAGINDGRPMGVHPPSNTEHVAEHHGLKVIQPLEPIVPPKERFAQELAALNKAANEPVAAAAPPKAPAAPPKPPVVSAPAPKAPEPPAVEAKPAPAPTPPPAPVIAEAVPAVVKHVGEMLPSAPEPAIEGVISSEVAGQMSAPAFDDGGLPQAESLAANDVAKARAEREAQAAMSKPEPEPVPEEAKESVSEPKEAEKPAESPSTEQAPVNNDDRTANKRRRRRGGRAEKPVEHIESEEEAEHNKPTEAAEAASTLTGKLILPTGEKPKPEAPQTKAEKPKKLAPGEVYVDESGNVIIGE